MSDIEHATEKRTWEGCMRLREDCQSKIFSAMKDNHSEVMVAINGIKIENMKAVNDINQKLAFMDGEKSASSLFIEPIKSAVKKDENGKRDWGDIFLRILIAWGPYLALLMILGFLAILKSKDWL